MCFTGNDRVYGSNGPDTVSDPGSGNDYIRTYNGNDSIEGGPGSDYLNGGAGDDIISDSYTDNAVDTVYGGPGADTFHVFSGGADVCYADYGPAGIVSCGGGQG